MGKAWCRSASRNTFETEISGSGDDEIVFRGVVSHLPESWNSLKWFWLWLTGHRWRYSDQWKTCYPPACPVFVPRRSDGRNHAVIEKIHGGKDDHFEQSQPRGCSSDGTQISSPRRRASPEDICRAELVGGAEHDHPIGSEGAAEEALETDRNASYFESHSGPLPHPAILKGYSRVDTGSPGHIMLMTEIDLETRTSTLSV